MRPRERAKSEGKVLYEPDEASGRTGAGDEKENHFLNAAKKWASYEKPVSYSAATLSREGWKRTHRKFNYSRFLNYTKETYV
jgi:2-keto-3-deoxy-galactonokinase